MRRIAAECLLALTCLTVGLAWRHSEGRGIIAAPDPAAAPRLQPPESPPVPGLPGDAAAAFTTALDDLDSALEDLPQQSPEQILKTVSKPGHGCALAWNGHYPSVVYGGTPSRPNSLGANLEGCAQAVKQLPH